MPSAQQHRLCQARPFGVAIEYAEVVQRGHQLELVIGRLGMGLGQLLAELEGFLEGAFRRRRIVEKPVKLGDPAPGVAELTARLGLVRCNLGQLLEEDAAFSVSARPLASSPSRRLMKPSRTYALPRSSSSPAACPCSATNR